MLCLRCYYIVGWDNHYLEEKTSFGVFFIFWLFGCWWNENLTQVLETFVTINSSVLTFSKMRWRACGTLFMDGELGQFPGLKKKQTHECALFCCFKVSVHAFLYSTFTGNCVQVTALSLLCRGGNLGTGQLCNLLKVTGWMSDDTSTDCLLWLLTSHSFHHVHRPL